MRRLAIVTVGVAALLSAALAQQPIDPIRAAADALGATSLTSLRFTALGASFVVGQSPDPTAPWPRVTLKGYDATINYDTMGMRVELVREQGSIPPRGGGVPFTGEQRLIEFVSGSSAWNVPLVPPPPPVPAPGGVAAAPLPTAGAVRFVEQPPEPQFSAATERMLQIVLTPHGFLRAAMANKATTRRVGNTTEVSFTVGGNYKITGIINGMNQVARVQTSIANAVLGDMPVEAVYSDYERLAGISFPMRIVQRHGGHPSLDLWAFSVQPNAAAEIAIPDTVRNASPPPVRVDAQRIADGIFYLTGGSHHSVAVEMSDHVVVIEGPLNEARSLAVIAKVNEAIPGKPIRFVVNTHHHFDHSGGLRTYADLGATIVTHEMNRPFYEKAWTAGRELEPDRLARSRRMPVFQTFTDKHVLTDDRRTVEVHRIANSPHHGGFAMVYMPTEKLLVEADAYTPPPSAAASATAASPGPVVPQGPVVNPTTRNLFENIRRLKLDVGPIAALHGARLATMDDLLEVSGR